MIPIMNHYHGSWYCGYVQIASYILLCICVDQHIIHLMQQYEVNGIDTSEFRYVCAYVALWLDI